MKLETGDKIMVVDGLYVGATGELVEYNPNSNLWSVAADDGTEFEVSPQSVAVDCSADIDPFDLVMDEIHALNRSKRADYATDDDPFSNFRDSAYQVGFTPGESCEVLIGTKQSRLRQLLLSSDEPNNESIRDTLIDRAVYSIIAVAMHDGGLYADDAA